MALASESLRSRLSEPPLFTHRERRSFARRQIMIPMVILGSLLILYGCLIIVSLAAPAPLAIIMTVPSGVMIGLLFIVGHDACHNSLTPSSRLNKIAGRVAFLPALHSFPLWDLAHNRTHHRNNNVRGWDYVWEPLTASDYRAKGPLSRALYRFHRTPVGVPFYYLTNIWAPRLVAARFMKAHQLDTILIVLFAALQIWGVITLGGLLGKDPVTSLMTGMVLPFLIWNFLISFIIFLHHTHPAVRWYASVAAWEANAGAIGGTAHVRFPWPFGPMVLAIMEHNAHHLAPGVPLYNLPDMQSAMENRLDIVSWRFSWRAYFRICRRCKLYDYAAGRWVVFNPAYDSGAGGRDN